MGRKSTFNDKDAAEIYALIDPRDGQVRYIGKAQNSKRRLAAHLREARRRTPVYDWIRKLRSMGLTPTVRVLSVTSDWRHEERKLIAWGRALGCRLLNIADGGDQPACSQEQRSLNAKALNARYADDPDAFKLKEIKRRLLDGHKRGQLSVFAVECMRECYRADPVNFAAFGRI